MRGLTVAERAALARVAEASLCGRPWSAWLEGVPNPRAESVLLAALWRKGLVERVRLDWGGLEYRLARRVREILAAAYVLELAEGSAPGAGGKGAK